MVLQVRSLELDGLKEKDGISVPSCIVLQILRRRLPSGSIDALRRVADWMYLQRRFQMMSRGWVWPRRW
jgi:hypothetical protein